VRVHRNNRVYDLLMRVCQLIYGNPFLEMEPGRATFPDFVGSRGDMARLFEQFVYQFYLREQRHFAVRRPVIEWHAGDDDDLAMLPIMRTDVVLSAANRRLVIDTKYYERTFQEYRATTKIRSPHLYQLIAYLQNIAAGDQKSARAAPPIEGMLLYPVVDAQFKKVYTLLGHRVTVRSVDLSRPWPYIQDELLQAIELPSS
jgi:5-methylcytosine-specific restriction enzyme subunit McrC